MQIKTTSNLYFKKLVLKMNTKQINPYCLNQKESKSDKLIYIVIKLNDNQQILTDPNNIKMGQQCTYNLYPETSQENEGKIKENLVQNILYCFNLSSQRSNHRFNQYIFNEYISIQFWDYQRIQLIGSIKLHSDFFKENQTQYKLTTTSFNREQIKLNIFYHRINTTTGTSLQNQSPFSHKYTYKSPAHYKSTTLINRGGSLNINKLQSYQTNPQKKIEKIQTTKKVDSIQLPKKQNNQISLKRVMSSDYGFSNTKSQIKQLGENIKSKNSQSKQYIYNPSNLILKYTQSPRSYIPEYSSYLTSLNKQSINNTKKISIRNRNLYVYSKKNGQSNSNHLKL